jgi:hypothetical protein
MIIRLQPTSLAMGSSRTVDSGMTFMLDPARLSWQARQPAACPLLAAIAGQNAATDRIC